MYQPDPRHKVEEQALRSRADRLTRDLELLGDQECRFLLPLVQKNVWPAEGLRSTRDMREVVLNSVHRHVLVGEGQAVDQATLQGPFVHVRDDTHPVVDRSPVQIQVMGLPVAVHADDRLAVRDDRLVPRHAIRL